MVTEFVLYDLSHPSKPASEILRTCESNESTDQSKVNLDLETAAIVIQFPSEKQESLKCNRGVMKNDDLFDFSRIKLEKKQTSKSECCDPFSKPWFARWRESWALTIT